MTLWNTHQAGPTKTPMWHNPQQTSHAGWLKRAALPGKQPKNTQIARFA